MNEGQNPAKVQMICETCGSAEVTRDAWAEWDTGAQEWTLGAVFDYAFCHHCETETRIAEVPLEAFLAKSGSD